jgi:hypothetical protein
LKRFYIHNWLLLSFHGPGGAKLLGGILGGGLFITAGSVELSAGPGAVKGAVAADGEFVSLDGLLVPLSAEPGGTVEAGAWVGGGVSSSSMVTVEGGWLLTMLLMSGRERMISSRFQRLASSPPELVSRKSSLSLSLRSKIVLIFEYCLTM